MATLVGLHPEMLARVQALLRDPDAVAHTVIVNSGFRSIAYQTELYHQAEEDCRRNPARCPASRWVARPGTSNHGPKTAQQLLSLGYSAAFVDGQGGGIAVDFKILDWNGRIIQASAGGQWPTEVSNWFKGLAGKYGLYQRMPWEDWHFEPMKLWTGKPLTREEYNEVAVEEHLKNIELRLIALGDEIGDVKKIVTEPIGMGKSGLAPGNMQNVLGRNLQADNRIEEHLKDIKRHLHLPI
jgi:hypothetical protein